MKVVFTERAFVSILAETAEKVQTETGGIFLGIRDEDIWYVVEAIDPGPKSVFEIAYFEYDQKYVSHLATKVARLYKKPLELLGLWHRHPGSFDKFSGTDDGTNSKYASLNNVGAISALVNIDPEFRLTIYHVTNPLSYRKVQYEIGDNLIPMQYRELCDSKRLLDYLNAKVDSIWGISKQKKPQYKYDLLLLDVLNNLISLEITEEVAEREIKPLTDSDVNYLLESIEVDINCFGDCYLDCQLLLQNRFIQLTVQKEQRIVIEFYIAPNGRDCMFKYKERYYGYVKGMFSFIIEDIILAMKKHRLFFRINKELVECSIQKARKS